MLRTDRPTDDRRPTDLSFDQYWGNFKWPYLREGSSGPLLVWFYGGVFEVSGSSGAISSFAKSKMAARPASWKVQMAISPRRKSDVLRVWFYDGVFGSVDRMALIPV